MGLVWVECLCTVAGLCVSTEVVQMVVRVVSTSLSMGFVLGGGLSVLSEGALDEAVRLLASIPVVLRVVEGVCVSPKVALVETMLVVASLVAVLGSAEGPCEEAELSVAVEREVKKDAFVVTLLKALLVWDEEV